MNLNRSILCFVLVALLAACQCQKAEKYTAQNPCISKQTCGDCIQTRSCAWCFQPEFGDRPRCFQPSMDSANGRCDEKFVYNPDNLISSLQNRSLSRGKWSASGSVQQTETLSGGSSQSSAAAAAAAAAAAEVVQISPQRVRLELRRNEAQKLTIKYAQAQDYPVDLYYLMDLSKSMENDKEKLSALGDLLANTMRNITSNFRLGFGSFVDKVVMPFVSTVPKNLEHPCDGCVKPYGFKNEMPLSTDTFHFSSAVKDAQVSGNLDAPEGGFDAIMQAVVCKQEIGWREKARRLLVFSTDAGFHYAGDGKLGGIVQPNDGACHMVNGTYQYSTIQDYPSISHINLKVKQESINVIFAVTQEQISVYEQLRAHIEGASSGVLSNDSSNVVDFVKDQYNKISSAVEMKDNSKGEVKITYHSSCLGGGSLEETNRCEGLKVGDEVHFEAEITVLECPADRSQWTQTFQIYPVGISESLTVELQMLCDCPCERPGHPMYEEHALVCSEAGLSACGVCKCDPGRFGRRCECSAAGGGAGGAELANACRPLNATTGVECSGRGNCVCGQCECQKLPNPLEEITGQFCECDNFSCDRNSNMLCSGPEHGTCVCGQCVCNEGWSGPACDCRSLNNSCIAPGSTEVCSGHGSCECGQCVCNTGSEGEAHYAGRFCESCTTCPGRCVEFKECVVCQHYKLYGEGKSEKECNETCSYEIIPVNTVIQDESKGEHICTYRTEDGCNYSYKYYYNETNKVYIEVQDKLDCPPPVFILGIVLGVIAAIVLVGLALLMLWKMVTTIHDRREFARFEKERMMAKWDTGENPIYKQATSTFKNPTYAGK